MTYHNTPPEFFRKAGMNILSGWQSGSWFGYSEEVGTTEVALSPRPWDIVFPSEAGLIQVSSTEAVDNSAGTGVQAVHVEGLDSDYNIISEEIELSGITPVTSSLEYLRVNSMRSEAVGSLGSNAGDIWVSLDGATTLLGVPTTDSDKLLVQAIGDNQSNCAWATVPAGNDVHITAGLWTVGADKVCRIAFFHQEPEDTPFFRKVGDIELRSSGVSFDFYRKFPEKSDIKIMAIAGLASTSVSAYYNYILERHTNGE